MCNENSQFLSIRKSCSLTFDKCEIKPNCENESKGLKSNTITEYVFRYFITIKEILYRRLV